MQKCGIRLQVRELHFDRVVENRDRGLRHVRRVRARARDQGVKEEYRDALWRRTSKRKTHRHTALQWRGVHRAAARSQKKTAHHQERARDVSKHIKTSKCEINLYGQRRREDRGFGSGKIVDAKPP